jgi:hypothetical protein
MNTAELRRAYAQFIETASRGPFTTPANGEWSAEMVLAHVIVGDRLIAEAAARVVAGGAPSFDNAASQSEPYLRSIIQAAASWDNLVTVLRQGAEELMALAHQMTDAQAATPVPARIVSGDQVVLDAVVPVGKLVNGPADVHLRLHLEQLGALKTREPSAIS